MAGIFGQQRDVEVRRRNLITDICCEDESCPKTKQRNRIRKGIMSPSALRKEDRLTQSKNYEPKTIKEMVFGPQSKVTLRICRARLIENGVRTDRVKSMLENRLSDEEAKRFVVKLLK